MTKRSFFKYIKIKYLNFNRKHPKLLTFRNIFIIFCSILLVLIIIWLHNINNEAIKINENNNTYNEYPDNTHIPAAELEKLNRPSVERQDPSKGIVFSHNEMLKTGWAVYDATLRQMYLHHSLGIDAWFLDDGEYNFTQNPLTYINEMLHHIDKFEFETARNLFIFNYEPDLYFLRELKQIDTTTVYQNLISYGPIVIIQYYSRDNIVVFIKNEEKYTQYTKNADTENQWKKIEENKFEITQTTEKENNSMDDLILILIIGGLVFYFFPSILASVVNNKNKFAIMVLNLFLGWTILGWVIALVWACCITDDKEKIIIQEKTQEIKQDYLNEIEKLAELKEKGIITEEEFNAKKAKLLE